jgi:hypothetical protein
MRGHVGCVKGFVWAVSRIRHTTSSLRAPFQGGIPFSTRPALIVE